MPINEYGLYLASWEHLYLIPNGVPAGLPNQVFSRQPWVLILFEHIYCDEHGLRGERNAATRLGWTNSRLFVKLASAELGIITPVNLSTPVNPYVKDVQSHFESCHAMDINAAVKADAVTVDELFDWRLQLIEPFLNQHRLILYDWPLAGRRPTLPAIIKDIVAPLPPLKIPKVPLTRDWSELTDDAAQVFRQLQDFEKPHLIRLRTGQITQPDYLTILEERRDDYRKVDLEITPGTDANLYDILRYRDRFGKRGGWKLLRNLLTEERQGADAEALAPLVEELRKRLKSCALPTMSELADASWGFAKALIKTQPPFNKIETASSLGKGGRNLANLIKEAFYYFRGDHK
jgi:hypothetical protein